MLLAVTQGRHQGAASKPTIAIGQVLQILHGVRQRGLAIDPILRRAGIAPALLDAPLSRVTQAQYAALIMALRRVTRDELWGLCATAVKPGSFSLLGRSLVHCRTLADAYRMAFSFYHLQLDDFVARLMVDGPVATVRVVIRRAQAADDLALAYALRSFCFMGYGVASWLVARRIPLIEVNYPSHQAQTATDAHRLFQAPVVFSGDWIGYRFDSRWLDLPVVQNPQTLNEFLQQAPASLVVRYRDQASLTERIRRLLRKHLATEMPTLEEVGHALAMTPQTLRRRLAAEGQGYQAIKDELRRDAAIEFLSQPELTLVVIANRVGFSEASTFHRAFKAWTGLAPGAYRQSHLRQGEAEAAVRG